MVRKYDSPGSVPEHNDLRSGGSQMRRIDSKDGDHSRVKAEAERFAQLSLHILPIVPKVKPEGVLRST